VALPTPEPTVNADRESTVEKSRAPSEEPRLEKVRESESQPNDLGLSLLNCSFFDYPESPQYGKVSNDGEQGVYTNVLQGQEMHLQEQIMEWDEEAVQSLFDAWDGIGVLNIG
jgi:hypothetical protein